MNKKKYNVRFSTTVSLSGDIQIISKDTGEAMRLARKMLRQNLDNEDCIIELGDSNEIITIREISMLPNVTALDIKDVLDL